MYQGSHKGKAGQSTTSCTSPCVDPAEEPSPSEGMGEDSLSFFMRKRKKPFKDSVTERLREFRIEEGNKGKSRERGDELGNISESEKIA